MIVHTDRQLTELEKEQVHCIAQSLGYMNVIFYCNDVEYARIEIV